MPFKTSLVNRVTLLCMYVLYMHSNKNTYSRTKTTIKYVPSKFQSETTVGEYADAAWNDNPFTGRETKT